MKRFSLSPKLLTVFNEGYSLHQFARDLSAGLVVGIVALPLAIAFAIASGVKPEQGLYTAIIAGFVVALLGGSRAQVSGPTGAFIVVIAGVVQQYGYEGLAVATLLAGIILVCMGFMGLGMLLKFVPYPLTVGFTSGIAVIILTSQIKDFLGLQVDILPTGFLPKWQVLLSHLDSINYYAFGIAVIALVLIIYLPRVNSKVPGSLVAMLLCTIAVHALNLPVETIGSRFGEVPNNLPQPGIPQIDWENLHLMFKPAFTIALLGGIESLLSAVVADGMLGTRHRSNTELIAQGVGNIISPFFQGIPATGAIARTATNIKNGGRTPVAAMFHALVLVVIMYFFAEYAALIPMAVLAAILINVAYNMSEWHAFLRILRYPKSDVAVLLVTFLLTVLIDLTVAIEVGVVLAAFLFIKRMEETAGVNAISDMLKSNALIADDSRDFHRASVPEGVEVFEVFGPMFFSAVDRFSNSLSRFEKMPQALILYMPRVNSIDGSAIRAIQAIADRLNRSNCRFLIAGAQGQTLKAILDSATIPSDRIFANLQSALDSVSPEGKNLKSEE